MYIHEDIAAAASHVQTQIRRKRRKKSEIDPRRVLRTQITDHRNFMDIDDSNNSSNNNGGDLSK